MRELRAYPSMFQVSNDHSRTDDPTLVCVCDEQLRCSKQVHIKPDISRVYLHFPARVLYSGVSKFSNT